MLTKSENTAISNEVEITLDVKKHVLALKGKSVAEIRHQHRVTEGFLSASQIKRIRDEYKGIDHAIDAEIIKDSKITVTALKTAVREKFDDTAFVDEVYTECLKITEAGTYTEYVKEIVKTIDPIGELPEVTI